ncbi:MAG: ABC transporter ATP-binding protein, partial [Sphingobacteriaceae bacterium]
MKIYFRLLSFAKPIEKFAIPYVIFTILYVIFSTSVLALLIPLLDTLFNAKPATVLVKPSGSGLGLLDIKAWFNYYQQYFINTRGQWAALQYVCGVMIVAVILGNLFRYLAQRIMESLRIHTLLKIRRAVFSNVMQLHLGYFNNERKGDILSKIATEVQVVQFSVTGTLQVIFKEPFQLIAFLITLFAISVKLTLISLLVVPIAGLIIARIVKRLRSQAVAAQNSYANMVSYLDEALSGIRIIKAFNATDFITKRFDDENIRYSKIVRSMSKRQQMASPVSEILSITMISFIVLYGGYMVLNKQSDLTPAEFIGYIGLFSQLMRPAKAISDAFSNIHSGLAAGERILQLIDEKPQIVDAPDATEVTDFNDSVHFNSVSFAYNEKTVLNHINLVVPKGKTVALVGPSGGGKSTLMDLIPRFIDPKAGEILIDGKDLRSLTSHSLRSLMGIVNQESIFIEDFKANAGKTH